MSIAQEARRIAEDLRLSPSSCDVVHRLSVLADLVAKLAEQTHPAFDPSELTKGDEFELTIRVRAVVVDVGEDCVEIRLERRNYSLIAQREVGLDFDEIVGARR